MDRTGPAGYNRPCVHGLSFRMYKDNSLIPSEAVRLAALGLLAMRPRAYADLARDIRHFTARIVGPSLDLLGPSLELLKIEGLIEAIDPKVAERRPDRPPDQGRRGRTAAPDDRSTCAARWAR